MKSDNHSYVRFGSFYINVTPDEYIVGKNPQLRESKKGGKKSWMLSNQRYLYSLESLYIFLLENETRSRLSKKRRKELKDFIAVARQVRRELLDTMSDIKEQSLSKSA
jgi:hypothetical protein